jgi:hypothetical protein
LEFLHDLRISTIDILAAIGRTGGAEVETIRHVIAVNQINPSFFSRLNQLMWMATGLIGK